MEDDVEYVKLISSDGCEFVVDKNAACVSRTLSAMLSNGFSEADLKEITLSELPGNILEKVCQYFYYKRRYTESVSEIPDFPIEPEVALNLLMAASYLDT